MFGYVFPGLVTWSGHMVRSHGLVTWSGHMVRKNSGLITYSSPNPNPLHYMGNEYVWFIDMCIIKKTLMYYTLTGPPKLRSVGLTNSEPGRSGRDLGWGDILHDRVGGGLPRLCQAVRGPSSPKTCHQQGHWHRGAWLSAGWGLGHRQRNHLLQ